MRAHRAPISERDGLRGGATMAGKKRADIEKQIADLTAQLDAADNDDDVELLVEKDGAKTALRGAHAKRWLKKLGLDDDEDQADADATDGADAGDGAGDDAKGDAGTDPKPKPNSRFFR